MIRFRAAITLGAFNLDAAFESDAGVLALFFATSDACCS